MAEKRLGGAFAPNSLNFRYIKRGYTVLMRKASGDSKRDSGTSLLVVGKFATAGMSLPGRCEFSATPCRDARDALKMLGQGRHKAVLCDLEMPGLDGMGLLYNVCADFPDVAVVVITPPGKLRNGVLAMLAGASGYIQTPLQPGVVVASLRTALKRKQLNSAMSRFDLSSSRCA